MPEGVINTISTADFGKLFTEYKPRFVAVAYRYVRDTGVAEDLVSDSFMAFWEARERLAGEVNIPAYILTSVRNRCLNHLQSDLRHLRAQKDFHGTHSRTLQADIRSLSLCNPHKLLSDEIDDLLSRAVHKMPKLRREVFLRSRLDEMTYEEIASNLSIKISRVNFEMSRALTALRVEFADYLPLLVLLLLISSIF